MKKTYILDTNVLLHDPLSIFAFEDNHVIIPAVVLEELDAKKRYMDEIGRNAREVARLLDQLRTEGPLHKGVELPNHGTLTVELNHRSFDKLAAQQLEPSNDNRILAITLNIIEQSKQAVIIVSKDALLRIKADAFGIHSEDYLTDRVPQYDHIYKGYQEEWLDADLMDKLYKERMLTFKEAGLTPTHPNHFYVFKDASSGSRSAIAMTDAKGASIKLFHSDTEGVWGIRPRNVQQRMALELLTREDIPLVTLVGKAGTGKTLLSLAAGLYLTEDLGHYKKLLVARPVVPMGKDLGYLPGEKEEKLRPWMQPIYDNLEFLFNTNRAGELDDILAGMNSIQVEALTYIRGRSIPDQFIIIDEAQNLTKHEVKTIITRVGENSKIVLMGDPKQIDHPYLDEYTNGLSYVTERMKHLDISGHMKLEKGERSGLAQLAADLL
ncbi:PhoH family protein [Paenalkalicoccus suaedae]|uniref:PhoH family protein n=1 Tax=Paenalkalicoccus suaedae TaxID=2592382 RepID=A0A859FFC9_9BACI|nr:PhoH family protein [Paenalkalicoccus suaedae]QKS71560.1 PhoH family protein [Paenalkalicoccus suaedae]